jgi:prepilin-type N-terminal cleavage/methylation domain-containing protein
MLSNHEDGFTLLEVTLAMVIMGIVLVPILGLFFSSRAHYELSTEETIAVYLAQEKMEEIIGTKIHEVVDNPDSWEECHGFPGFYYQVEVTPPKENKEGDNDKLNLYKIHVRVQYQTGGKTREIALSTYLVDRMVDK